MVNFQPRAGGAFLAAAVHGRCRSALEPGSLCFKPGGFSLPAQAAVALTFCDAAEPTQQPSDMMLASMAEAPGGRP